MKRKLMAILLSIAILVSAVPAADAASTAPGQFSKPVGMPLLPARSEGLYDTPEHPLPDGDASGFIRDIDGWTPAACSGQRVVWRELRLHPRRLRLFFSVRRALKNVSVPPSTFAHPADDFLS